MGRSWVSEPGAALTFSVLLRPGSVPASRLGWLPLLAGVAVATAVRSVARVPATLKWPNDVLAGDRKLAGILAEQSGDAIVIGIGLNVATPAAALPVSAATSLLVEGSDAAREPLLAEILRRCPSLEGTLFDLPTTIKATDLLEPYREQDRCRLVAGDMFDRVPPGAGGYVLKRVLHDWDDAACTRILHNCAAAMRGDGRVVVIEGVVPEGNEPHPQKEGDLVMMVLLRGRERTLAEFEELFRAASLHLDEVVPLPSGHSILLGRRP